MEVYLINRETNEIKDTYTHVDKWADNFVDFTTNGLRTKIYCDIESEYFSNVYETNKELEKEREE